MRKILLVLFSFLVITFAGLQHSTGADQKSNSTYSVTDDNEFTYVHVYIDGKHFIYVYLGDLIWEIHEVEE